VSLDRLLHDVAGYLEFEIAEGRDGLEVNPRTAARLKGGEASSRPSPAFSPRSSVAAPGAGAPAVDAAPADAAEELRGISLAVAECRKCPLHATRRKAVPGQGCLSPDILFVGEAPGEDEDRQGLAFVGAAGQLLTRMIEAMGYTREQVFIANVLKCRPPDNRTPMPDEMEACAPYLRAQIRLLKPKVIVTLGAVATKGLLGLTTGITRLRGKWLSFDGIQVMPTFHPAYLLRMPSAKRDAWEDLQAVLKRLGRTPPPVRKRGPAERES
jgi:uracil-DNA glycosylase